MDSELKTIYQGGHHIILCNGKGVHYEQIDDCKEGLGHCGQLRLLGLDECLRWNPPCITTKELDRIRKRA